MNSLIASEFKKSKQIWVPIKENSRDWKKLHLWPVLEACSNHFEPLRPPLESVLAAEYELDADKEGVVIVTLHRPEKWLLVVSTDLKADPRGHFVHSTFFFRFLSQSGPRLRWALSWSSSCLSSPILIIYEWHN